MAVFILDYFLQESKHSPKLLARCKMLAWETNLSGKLVRIPANSVLASQKTLHPLELCSTSRLSGFCFFQVLPDRRARFRLFALQRAYVDRTQSPALLLCLRSIAYSAARSQSFIYYDVSMQLLPRVKHAPLRAASLTFSARFHANMKGPSHHQWKASTFTLNACANRATWNNYQ